MTEGQPWKHIIRFALPILAGSLHQQLYNTVDTIIVGKYYGEELLSAVGTTISFTFLFLARMLVTYLFRYSSFFGYSIIWWNGLFGFGMGFLVSWTYYLSGRWKKNFAIAETGL